MNKRKTSEKNSTNYSNHITVYVFYSFLLFAKKEEK